MSDRLYFGIVFGLFTAWTLTGLYNNGWQVGGFGPGLIIGVLFVGAMFLARIYMQPNTKAADAFGEAPEDWRTRTRNRLRLVARHWRWIVAAIIIGFGVWFLAALDWNLPVAIGIVVLVALLMLPTLIGDFIGGKVEAQAQKSRIGRILMTSLWIIIGLAVVAGGILAWLEG